MALTRKNKSLLSRLKDFLFPSRVTGGDPKKEALLRAGRGPSARDRMEDEMRMEAKQWLKRAHYEKNK